MFEMVDLFPFGNAAFEQPCLKKIRPELELKTSTKIILYLIAAIVAVAFIYFFLPPIYEFFIETHHSEVYSCRRRPTRANRTSTRWRPGRCL